MSQMSSCFCLVVLSVKYLNKNMELFSVIKKIIKLCNGFRSCQITCSESKEYCALGCYRYPKTWLWFGSGQISCGVSLFKLQPTKLKSTKKRIRFFAACLNGMKLSKIWCRESRKLWQIQQVGLPQKARFSNLGTRKYFSRRTDLNMHTLTCANQPIRLKLVIVKALAIFACNIDQTVHRHLLTMWQSRWIRCMLSLSSLSVL